MATIITCNRMCQSLEHWMARDKISYDVSTFCNEYVVFLTPQPVLTLGI